MLKQPFEEIKVQALINLDNEPYCSELWTQCLQSSHESAQYSEEVKTSKLKAHSYPLAKKVIFIQETNLEIAKYVAHVTANDQYRQEQLRELYIQT